MTEAEYVEAMRQALRIVAIDDGPDVFTSAEWAKKLKANHSSTKKHISEALDAGRIEKVWTRRETRNGRMQRVPGYKVVVADGRTDRATN